MKKNMLVACAAAMLACVALLASCATSSAAGKVIERDKYLETKISYPAFSGCPAMAEKVKSVILDSYSTFKSTVETNWEAADKARKDTGARDDMSPFEYIVTCGPVVDNGKFASVLITTYIYDGGAHGETALSSVTYDKKAQKFISVSDINGFTPDSLSVACRNALDKSIVSAGDDEEAKKSKTDWIAQGTEPSADKFDVFTYDGKKLVIYFAPYAVAPYANGIQKVEIAVKK